MNISQLFSMSPFPVFLLRVKFQTKPILFIEEISEKFLYSIHKQSSFFFRVAAPTVCLKPSVSIVKQGINSDRKNTGVLTKYLPTLFCNKALF